MKVRVNLYGTLRQRFPAYRPSEGIEVDLPEGATVRDLLSLLDIPESQRAVVVVESRILKAEDKLQRGVPVNVLQAMGGG